MIEMRFEGIDAVRQAFDRAESLALDELERAVDESTEHLLSTSMRLAPKLTGDLEGSGTKDPTVRRRDEIVGTMGFRGLPYARRRHEEVYTPGLITRGKPQVDGMTPGRKYIEQPLMKYVRRYIEEWADAVRRVLS